MIFQLRNQNGHQSSNPGACNIFSTLDGEEVTPAHRLVKIGYDAVPQLIEVLEDHVVAELHAAVGRLNGLKYWWNLSVLRILRLCILLGRRQGGGRHRAQRPRVLRDAQLIDLHGYG